MAGNRAGNMARRSCTWIAVAALCVSCGGASAGGTVGNGATAEAQSAIDWRADPVLLFPAECTVFMRLDFDRVRQSPHGEVLFSLLGQAVEPPLGHLLADLAPKTNDVHGCFVQGDHDAPMLAVLLIRGTYAEREFEAVLPHLGLSDRHRIAPQTWASDAVHAAEIAPDVWVIGDEPLHTELVGRSQGTRRGASLRENETFAAQASAGSFGQGAAEVIALRPNGREAGSGTGRFAERLMSDVVVASGRLDLQRDANVFLRGEFASATKAREYAQALEGMVGQYAHNMIVELLGVGPLLRRIEVRTRETQVEVRAAATEQELRDLLGRFGRMAARMVAGGA